MKFFHNPGSGTQEYWIYRQLFWQRKVAPMVGHFGYSYVLEKPYLRIYPEDKKQRRLIEEYVRKNLTEDFEIIE